MDRLDERLTVPLVLMGNRSEKSVIDRSNPSLLPTYGRLGRRTRRPALHLTGRPWRNGDIESFNSRVRDECRNINMLTWFLELNMELPCVWGVPITRSSSRNMVAHHFSNPRALGRLRSRRVALRLGRAFATPWSRIDRHAELAVVDLRRTRLKRTARARPPTSRRDSARGTEYGNRGRQPAGSAIPDPKRDGPDRPSPPFRSRLRG
jgi:hypothetical protein